MNGKQTLIAGAWVSTLTLLEPLRPVFVGLTLLLLAMAWRKLHRAPACVPGQACADPQVRLGPLAPRAINAIRAHP